MKVRQIACGGRDLFAVDTEGNVWVLLELKLEQGEDNADGKVWTAGTWAPVASLPGAPVRHVVTDDISTEIVIDGAPAPSGDTCPSKDPAGKHCMVKGPHSYHVFM